jgi:hypothetical protein
MNTMLKIGTKVYVSYNGNIVSGTIATRGFNIYGVEVDGENPETEEGFLEVFRHEITVDGENPLSL